MTVETPWEKRILTVFYDMKQGLNACSASLWNNFFNSLYNPVISPIFA